MRKLLICEVALLAGIIQAFQSLSLFDYEKLFQALMNHLDTFSRENRLEEGMMLDDYVVIFKQFKTEHQAFTHKRDAYMLFRDEIRAKLRKVDDIFNAMELNLKDIDQELANMPRGPKIRQSSPGRNAEYGSPGRAGRSPARGVSRGSIIIFEYSL